MRFLPDGRLQTGYQPLIQDALYKAGLGLIDIEDIATWASSHQKYDRSLCHSCLE